MDVYSRNAYGEVLADFVAANKTQRGYQRRLSEAAGCHTSYLSQVRAGKAQLTPDQAAGLAHFWQLDEAASDYFLTLVQLDRAGSAQLKGVLRSRLERLRKEHNRLAAKLKTPSILPNEAEIGYYTTWRHAVVHMAALVPGWQSEAFLAKRLGLPLELIEGSLAILERLGLLERSAGRWAITGHLQHLSDASPMLPIHQANFRELARARTQVRSSQDVQYSGVYALSEQDCQRLRQETLDFIQRTRQIVLPSPEETIACIVCDFFEL